MKKRDYGPGTGDRAGQGRKKAEHDERGGIQRASNEELGYRKKKRERKGREREGGGKWRGTRSEEREREGGIDDAMR